MKKIMSMILVLTMTMSLFVGCGSTPEEETSSKSETPVETSEESSEVSYEESSDEISEEEIVLKEPIETEELGSGDVKWTENLTGSNFMYVVNDGGETLSYSPDSGISLIQVDGFAFKDLNKNSMLDQYEDWREPDKARAKKLSLELQIEEIAGLFLHSGYVFDDTSITDDQKSYMDNGLRAFLNIAAYSPAEVTANWANEVQAYAEASEFGIPITISSNPREEGNNSIWPKDIGLAASFDIEVANKAGQAMSTELRVMGINEALRPLTSIITDPRHYRFEATYGEDPLLTADMNNAIISGLQSTYDENGKDLGWGVDSMTAMAKRFPGNGSSEGGRNGHAKSGWLDVFPGGGEEAQFIPYMDGAFALDSLTETAAAVMISYSTFDTDTEQVGGAFSEYVCDTLLRERFEFEGVACSDWGILDAKDHGVEELTVPEQMYEAILAGLDQFGNWNTTAEVMEAYEMLVTDFGVEEIDERFRETATRVLYNKFIVGIFENPYVDLDETSEVVGSEKFQTEAFDAQLKSIIMLKNENNVIKASVDDEKPTVYVPMSFNPRTESYGVVTPATYALPYSSDILSEYFIVVTDTVAGTLTGTEDEEGKATVSEQDIVRATTEELANVDYALAIAAAPVNLGSYGDGFGYNQETEEYIPISLQYGSYTADSEYVRKESLAGVIVEVEKTSAYGVQIVEEQENRSYYGKDAVITNSGQLDTILCAAENVPEDKPVIVVLDVEKPMIVSEFESQVDSILVSFSADPKAVLDIVTGKYEPSALLPSQWPADMIAVEKQLEDLPRDMDCYKDSAGNVYDFTYGLNWSGVINDERVEKYNIPVQMTPNNMGNVE